MSRIQGAPPGGDEPRAPLAVTEPARAEGLASPAAVLTSGPWRTLVTARGTGFSSLDEVSLTRWGADSIEDRDGLWIYLRDRADGALWSAAERPVPAAADRSHAEWRPGVLVIEREVHGIESNLEVCVDPHAACEIRRLTIVNRSGRPRSLDATTFAEIALSSPASHLAHPAFSKLFIQTEFDAWHGALTAHRRARRAAERHPWLAHALVGEGRIEFETDRSRFIGRGRDAARPAAFDSLAPLSGTVGNVLDPVLSLRRVFDLAPGERAIVASVLCAAGDRAAALALVASFTDPGRVAAAMEGASEAAHEELRRSGLEESEAARLDALAVALLEGRPGLRAPRSTPARLARHADSLRALGLVPGRECVLIDARHGTSREALARMAAAQRRWRAQGLPIDVCVLAHERERWEGLLPSGGDGMPVMVTSELAPEDVELLLSAAGVVVAGGDLPLAIAPRMGGAESLGVPMTARRGGAPVSPAHVFPESLTFFNGYGGFNESGDEYVIRMTCESDGRCSLPPRPWINVLANESFGTLVSETGAGYTWSQNSREHRLTPWWNDPVMDPHGEALYVRDEESGEFWSPLSGPAPAEGAYEMRHGFGYSTCRHAQGGIEHEVTIFVPREDPVKIVRVRLVNRGKFARRLSLFAYQQLVLAELPGQSRRFIETWQDGETNAIFARNPAAGEFSPRVAFAAIVSGRHGAPVRYGGDREAFLGLGGSTRHPLTLAKRGMLESRLGARLDPCFAAQALIELAPGESAELAVLLGEGDHHEHSRALLERYAGPGCIEAALDGVRRFWTDLLGRVRIETPSPALDLMVNGWLLYQTLACRIWGRSAFYQSGGAFGYRDQLQDAAAFVSTRPAWTRSQILLHAAHQFVEGDVLHWWHPPLDFGLRTRFADDLLWLPYVTSTYVRSTGDWAVLREMIPFLKARALAEGEDEALVAPLASNHVRDLYEHCCRAIDRSLALGAHGLPLFGTGDWNDGMNAVGREGRGESVWMGFFLCAVLEDFAPLCLQRGEPSRAERYEEHRLALIKALNESGWDGEWYRRGYYDDGEPLGSQTSEECRIDALAQAWAVLSGAASSERANQAMDSVERWLVSQSDGIISLLTPPFDRTERDPGYIRGYVPGVRENGGQYTHAALWVVRALAELGRNSRAATLLEMLSPVSHSMKPEQVAVYQVEPYAIAADVYGASPHVGRGGWTWYTGSSGWMFRVAVESILGLRVEGGDTIVLRPRIPREWDHCRIDFRPPGSAAQYSIRMQNSGGPLSRVTAATLEGAALPVEHGEARIRISQALGMQQVTVSLG